MNRPPCSASQKWSSIVSAVATASAIHEACPVASARRTKASTRAAWSAARASWRARGSPLACQARRHRPSPVRSSCEQEVGRHSAAASIQLGSPSSAPASASDGDHQRVPLRQHLVVEARPRAQLPGLEQRLAGDLDRRRPPPVAGPPADAVGDRAVPSKLPAVGDVVELAARRRRRRRARRRPRRASTCRTAPRGCGRRGRGSRRPRRRRSRRRVGAGRAARSRRSRRPPGASGRCSTAAAAWAYTRTSSAWS